MKRSRLKRKTGLKADPEKQREFEQRGRGGPQRAAPRAPVQRTCRTCGTTFTIRAAAAARGEGKYCSRACWPRKVFVKRSCENCGRRFEVEERQVKAGRGRFCSRACSNGPSTATEGTKPKRSNVNRRRFRSGQSQCVHPACEDPARPSHEHHVVYEQHVVRADGDVSDPRNALRLCISCHGAHHRRSRVVPLAALRDVNFEFAFELMGAAAYDYLRRRYAGEDARLEAWLSKTDTAADPPRRETRRST